MKTKLSLLLLIISTFAASAQTNLIWGYVGDYGYNTQRRVPVTFTLVSPKPRVYNNVLIMNDPRGTTSDTNGIFYCPSNMLWGRYTVSIGGAPGTTFTFYVGTNTLGLVSIGTLITNSNAMPPDPGTNYYTMGNIDALLASFNVKSLSSLDSSVTISNRGGGLYDLSVQVSGSSTNALSAADQLVVDNAVTNGISTNGIGITRSARSLLISTNYDHLGSAAAAQAAAQTTLNSTNTVLKAYVDALVSGLASVYQAASATLTQWANVPTNTFSLYPLTSTLANGAYSDTNLYATKLALVATNTAASAYNAATYYPTSNPSAFTTTTQASNIVTTINSLSATNADNFLWNNYSMSHFDHTPRGLSTWNGGVDVRSEDKVINQIQRMVSSGRVRNGHNWLMLDTGTTNGIDSFFPLVTNRVIYAEMTNSAPGGFMDFDTNAFPHGAAWLVSMAHSNGVKIILYAYNGPAGGGSRLEGTNVIESAQPGLLGNEYWFSWLSNAITVWGIDGIKDEYSPNAATNAYRQAALIAKLTQNNQKRFHWNVAAQHYFPWYRGLFNSWRNLGPNGSIGDNLWLSSFYLWQDLIPEGVEGVEGGFPDLDEYAAQIFVGDNYGQNRIAMDAMWGSAMLMNYNEDRPALRALVAGYYWAEYDNPLINKIHGDRSHFVTKFYTNTLMVAYKKQLADDSWVFAIQNRSNTAAQIFTLDAKEYYPAITSNAVFTIHDIFLDAPTSTFTNVARISINPTNITFFKLVPGVENILPQPTNSLANIPWTSANFSQLDPKYLQVNNRGAGLGAFPKDFMSNYGTGTNQTGIIMGETIASNSITWMLNGYGQNFTAQLGSWRSSNYFKYYGDGALLFSTITPHNTRTNVSFSVAGVKVFRFESTNTAATSAFLLSPLVTRADIPVTQTQWAATNTTLAAATAAVEAHVVSATNDLAALIGSGGYTPPTSVVHTNGASEITTNGMFSTLGLATISNIVDGYTIPLPLTNAEHLGNTPVAGGWLVEKDGFLVWTNAASGNFTGTFTGNLAGGTNFPAEVVFTNSGLSYTFLDANNRYKSVVNTNGSGGASTSFTNAMLRPITITSTSATIDLQPWTTNNTADLGFTLNLTTNVTLLQITNASGWAGKQFKIEVAQTAQFTIAFNTNNTAGCATWIPPSFGQFITVPTNTIASRQFIYVEIGATGTNAYILSQKNFVR